MTATTECPSLPRQLAGTCFVQSQVANTLNNNNFICNIDNKSIIIYLKRKVIMKKDFKKAASYARDAILSFCFSMTGLIAIPVVVATTDFSGIPGIIDEAGLLGGGIVGGIYYGVFSARGAYKAIGFFGSASTDPTAPSRSPDGFATRSVSLN